MPDHDCIHEVDLALIQQDVAEVKSDVKSLVKLIQGDNGEGWITRTAVLSKSLKIAWRFIWIIIVSLAGIAFFVVRAALT